MVNVAVTRLGALFGCVLLLAVGACQSSGTAALTPDGGEGGAASSQSLVGQSDGDLRVVAALAAPLQDTVGGVRLAENDLLEVDVFQVDDLDREVRIDAAGRITMPLIGQLQAAGKTATQLENDLEAQYGRNYLQNPEITVFVKESFGQRVTMDGEFKRPGVLPVTKQSTLLQVVAEAGGLSDIANPRQVFVFREFPNGKQVAAYNLSDIRGGKAADPQIFGGDVVVAFASGFRVAARNLREALGIASSGASILTPF